MPNITWDRLATGFAHQRDFCAGYSPLYETILDHASGIFGRVAQGHTLDFDEQAIIDVLDTEWSGRVLRNTIEASLLYLGGIHAAVLTEAPEASSLCRFYGTVGGSFERSYDTEVLRQMIGGFFMRPAPVSRSFLRKAFIQTNEISRGITWLLPALVMNAWDPDLQVTLVDLGCSAGLNLAADMQSWNWGERYLGSPAAPVVSQRLDFDQADMLVRSALPVGKLHPPAVARRVGIDLNPLHLENAHDVLLLRSCIWGDQPDRLARFDRGLKGYRSLDPAPQLESANIIDAAKTLDQYAGSGSRLFLVYNTAVTIYFDDTQYNSLTRNIETAFRALPSGVRGLWIELETPRKGDPAAPDKFSAMKAHFLDGSGNLKSTYLAVTESHPQTVHVLPGWTDVADALEIQPRSL